MGSNFLRQQLTKSFLLNKFGAQAYARGHDYFDDQRVLSVEVAAESNESVSLYSEVSGSRQKIYQQEITVAIKNNHLHIRGDCSCPMRFNCKHVAAACIQYRTMSLLHRNTVVKDTAPAVCMTWLDTFVEATLKPMAQQPSNEIVVYRLRPSKTNGKLKLELFNTKILKNGRLSKGSKINLSNINTIYSSDYVQPTDHEIGKLLTGNQLSSWHETFIEGELGYLALHKMIHTGRCFWQDSEQPLSNSSERTLTLNWHKSDRNSYKLNLSIIPNGMLLLTQPPSYLDTQQHLVGLISNDALSMQQLEKLLAAPNVPEQYASEFSQKIARNFSATVLPPPQPIKVKTISGQKPIPFLYLTTGVRGDHRIHFIRLSFNYDVYKVSVLPTESINTTTVNDEIIRIERNLTQEDTYVEQLTALGFERRTHDNPNDLIFLSIGKTSFSQGISRWHHFLDEALPELINQGWLVEYDPDFQLKFHDAGSNWDAEIEEKSHDWFNLSFKVNINGQPRSLLPLVTQVLDEYDLEELPEKLHLHLGNSEYLNLSTQQLKPVLNILYELYDSDTLDTNGSMRLSRFDAARLDELDQQSISNLQWRGGNNVRQLGRQLNNFEGIKAVPPPQNFNTTLRDYQQTGLNWLQFLREYHFCGILADDMGLGKTIQTLAHLLLEKQQGRLENPCLIIAPTSLMSNWRREAKQFAPELNVLVLQGSDRHENFDKIAENDIVLSTYPLLPRDEERLLAQHYYMLVLDEAQVVKNPKSKAAHIIRQINAQHRLCLTGTPMENHLGELWALFDFLMPGFLGDSRQFKTLFRTPIEQQANDERRRQLAKRVAPFMLRRSKLEVIKELPEKTLIIRSIALESKQSTLYESIRIAMEEKVRESIADKGLARSHITILDALLKLRQVCCDPRLLSLKQAHKVKQSAKLELLMQILPEMVLEGRRILLFSQFTKMLALIEDELNKHNIRYSKLTGQTRNRDNAIEQFQNGDASVFLISLKAGGVGLNLTRADTVIHYDPWWNPAAEDQATDRAHRIGQEKAVFVYKLVVENSVEEKILAMQQRKKDLTEGIYQQNGHDKEIKLTAADMRALFAPLS